MNKRYYSLYGRLLEKDRLRNGFKKVWKSKGVAGIDGQSLKDFAKNLESNLDQLILELKTKCYKPLPCKRVEIPKPDGGVRCLGLPSVRDKVIQQALLDILNPIFDKDFHPSSYGYRPKRSCHDAIAKATLFIRKYDRKHVVSMDLSKCFDRLDHELILEGIKAKVSDSSILNLINLYLVSGVMVEGNWQATEEGSPQGGVISPLLANIYLDRFDQLMMGRGHRLVRYADDILILCKSEKAADNARKQASIILEQDLKLKVNQEKSCVVNCHTDAVDFLGVSIGSRYTNIHPKKLKAFKQKIKQLTPRNAGKPLVETISRLNPVLRGFVNYFGVTDSRSEFKSLIAWIRRRLRSIQLKLWKKPSRLHRRLKQLGYKPPFNCIKMSSWRNANAPLATMSMRNSWFKEMGLCQIDELAYHKRQIFAAYWQ